MTVISPWIEVENASTALDFYARAFDATVQQRLDDGDTSRVVVAQLAIDEATFWVQEEPGTPRPDGGGPIRMILTVENPDALFAQAAAAGATEVFPVTEEHGWRTGRVADPFGYHWELSKPVG